MGVPSACARDSKVGVLSNTSAKNGIMLNPSSSPSPFNVHHEADSSPPSCVPGAASSLDSFRLYMAGSSARLTFCRNRPYLGSMSSEMITWGWEERGMGRERGCVGGMFSCDWEEGSASNGGRVPNIMCVITLVSPCQVGRSLWSGESICRIK